MKARTNLSKTNKIIQLMSCSGSTLPTKDKR